MLCGCLVNGAPDRSVRCAEFWRREPGRPGPDKTGGASRPVGDAVRMHVAEEESPDRKTHTSGIHEAKNCHAKMSTFFIFYKSLRFVNSVLLHSCQKAC